MDTTDIEKKSLEAHVELCAERYKLLELKLETLESNVDGLKTTIDEVHNIVRCQTQRSVGYLGIRHHWHAVGHCWMASHNLCIAMNNPSTITVSHTLFPNASAYFDSHFFPSFS